MSIPRGVDSAVSFAQAIRRALAESDSQDMRAVAARVVQGLPEDMLMEAAITHLSGMARRYYNQQLRETGTEGPSEELVSLRGVDVRLVDTEEDDRNWLARNRETLADGLRRSADRIRTLRGHQWSAGEDSPELLASDVARVERRAAQLRIAAEALERLMTDDSTEERLTAARASTARYEAETGRYLAMAERIVDGWKVSRMKLSRWTRTTNAVRELERIL